MKGVVRFNRINDNGEAMTFTPRMDDPDTRYFLARAEAELELAQAADHERAVQAHYVLANLYLERVYEQGGPATQIMETEDAEHA